MFLSDAEREALLRAGATVDRQGRFDHKEALVDDQVMALRALQDKGLVAREHVQYYLTPAGREKLDEIKQAEECKRNRTEEIRSEKQHEWVREIVLLLLGAIVTGIVTLLTR